VSAESGVVVRRSAVLQYAGLLVLLAAWRWPTGPVGALAVAVAGVLGVAFSLAAHEGAHAAVARFHGLRVVGVEVRGMLEASVRRAVTRDRQIDVRVRLAGPLATALLLAGCAAALPVVPPGEAARVLRLLVVVNLVTLVLSLVGGRRSDGVQAWQRWRAGPDD
jgi:peptidoglycan/LPS O-acetylase OafA/YrhL